MEKHFNIVAEDMDNAGIVSSKIKKELIRLELPKDLIRRVAIACYETEINVIIHSYGGYCDYEIADDHLEIIFSDDGPGIPDIGLAMQPGYSTASKYENELGFGAGMGFVNMKKNADNLSVTSSPSGTTVTLYFKLR